MEPQKVGFTKEKATSLVTLRGRAWDNRSPHPILGDAWAERILARLDTDIGDVDVRSWRGPVMSARARQLDLWTGDYLAGHPDATVLHLGCGLDSRVFRVDPPPSVRWFDVDYPEVVDLRRQLYPERASYTLLGASIADADWWEAVPRDRPAFIVAEGVTQYLTEPVVKALLQRSAAHFPEGRVAFDIHSRTLVDHAARSGWTVGNTGAGFTWGIDDAAGIPRLVPGYELLEEVRVAELARRFHLPWRIRLLLRLTSPFLAFRAMTCLLFRF